jgi:hypothetical protein
MVVAWGGAEEKEGEGGMGPRTLAENTRYSTIMRRTRGTKDERPQVTFFLDPIALFRSAGQDDIGSQAVIAALPVVGLDGLHAVGGGVVLSPEEYDLIGHLYVLMAEPREGVLEMIAPKDVDPTPEPWVPATVASYSTLQWDLQQSFSTFVEI